MTARGEFDLIREFFTRPVADKNVSLGIGDDAALLDIPSGHELAITTDTLVNGRHFPENALPYDIGWKALAVNLSDLAAMGAEARWVTLAITFPDYDEKFLRDFSRGFFALAGQENISLIGGDTTRGPLAVTVTAMGLVPRGKALRRDGAQVGDDIYVSGTVGDAGLGLRIVLEQWPEILPPEIEDFALSRLHRPTPRIGLGLRLRGMASAALDISDGLAQDLGHILQASGVGAEIDLQCLPKSAALQGIDSAFADVLALTSGDDYELLFTAPDNARAEIEKLSPACTRIGRITDSGGLIFLRNGVKVEMPVTGFNHF
jgi:thiamine-monophosphate kinase